MPTLSSCYFCGTALDAPLEEYPVVPQSLDPPQELQGSVVLCDSCKQKLARVLDPVVRAARDDASASREGDGGATRSTDDRAPRGAGGADGSREAEQPRGDRDAGRSDASTPQTGPTDETRQRTDEAPDETRQRTDETPDATFDDPQQEPVFGDAADEADDSDPHEPVFGSDEPTVDDGPVADAETEADPLTGAGNGSPEGDDADDGGTATVTETSAGRGDDSPSVKTYNRVMRLLENREFPVEEAAIREVAGSAYDVPDAEFEAVIQEAVDNGVLRRESGMLTR